MPEAHPDGHQGGGSNSLSRPQHFEDSGHTSQHCRSTGVFPRRQAGPRGAGSDLPEPAVDRDEAQGLEVAIAHGATPAGGSSSVTVTTVPRTS